MKLTAPCKDYIWGGTRLKTEYGKVSDKPRIAESWELSCHPDGLSVIANGEYAGRTLSAFIGDNSGVLGKNCEKFDRFPIIVKLIDASDDLSIQVHPNDEQGRRDGDWGKTETWHILDAAPDSELIIGFNREITREEFRERINGGTLPDVLNRVKIKKGDVFFIPAGTLHAIGKGALIAEVQQNSNLTYRVYDYGRRGADGKPRELHIDKAVEVTRLTEGSGNGATDEYFTVEKHGIAGSGKFCAAEESFNAVLVTEGEAEVDGVRLEKGSTCFIPANYGEYAVSGEARMLLIKV